MNAETLADKLDIQELTARYNRAADGMDPAPLLDLFSDGAVVEMRGSADGPRVYSGEEIAGLVAPTDRQRVHMTTDNVIEVNGDTATQVSSLLLITRSRRRGLMAIFTGRYDDELVRTPAGWRFARRTVNVDFANEGRATLIGVPDAGAA